MIHTFLHSDVLSERASRTSIQVSWHSYKPFISDYVTLCGLRPTLSNHCPIDGPNFLSSFATVVHHKMHIWCVYPRGLIFIRQCPGSGTARFRSKSICNLVDVARLIFRWTGMLHIPAGQESTLVPHPCRRPRCSVSLSSWWGRRETPCHLECLFPDCQSVRASYPVFSATVTSFYLNCSSMLFTCFHLIHSLVLKRTL